MSYVDIPEHLPAHVRSLRARPAAALPEAHLSVASRTSAALQRAVAQWSETQQLSDATVSQHLRSLHSFLDRSSALDSSLAANLGRAR
ncbi:MULTISPECIES: hypothetical protein [unclassified Corynebacterium]|uniref:hypothetical protein n=1 Tax=Corynebacterium TaxID=1716 RepID=UPI00255043BF|nr:MULTISPECIES: hypothetical protein [unclassified Corynebacterium]MDK8702732.1 hypothetical protein [Corynebacterium sp. MSK107]MDK8704855.1 hypothetical protein [Corynebacterium sp. MSK090]MDK8830344.1 hypothetical protein [Corynebacterium sp. MSK072]